jgi:hypothetical protein
VGKQKTEPREEEDFKREKILRHSALNNESLGF